MSSIVLTGAALLLSGCLIYLALKVVPLADDIAELVRLARRQAGLPPRQRSE